MRARLSIVFLFAVLGASCASGTTAPTTTSALFSDDGSELASTSDAPPTTIAEPQGEFEQLVAKTLPTIDDAPPNYAPRPVDLTAEFGGFCDDARPAGEQWLSAAAGAIEFEQDHLFRSDVTVFADSADAEASYAYDVDAVLDCDQLPRTDEDTGQIVLVTSADGEPFDLPGSDEAGTKLVRLATDAFAVDFIIIHARVDNAVLVSQGTNAATAVYFMDLMMARLLGEEDPQFVAPDADPILVEVDARATDAAQRVRGRLAEFNISPAAFAWFDSADDATVSEVADIVCPRLQAVTSAADLGAVYTDAFTESERETLDFDAGGQVMVAITSEYCPDVYDLLAS